MNKKTQGSFKIKSKPKLTEEQFAAKNKEPLIDIPSNVTRVVIPKEGEEATQEPAENVSNKEEPTKDSNEVIKEIPEPVIKEIIEESKPKEKIEIPAIAGPALPDNILPS